MTVSATPGLLDLRSLPRQAADGTLMVHEAGEGRPLLFLHGWTLDHRMWHPQLALADTFRLVLPDRRGFGASSAAPDLLREAEDIAGMVPEERFGIVGLSQGAAVALDFARRFPSRVSALALVGAPLHGAVPFPAGDGEEIPRKDYARLVQSGRLAAMKAAWQRNRLVSVREAARPLVDAILADYRGADLMAPSAVLEFSAGDIAALAMPVLAIAGAADTPWRRACARFIGETAPRGQAALIDDAGHLCNLDNPGQFNALLRDFFSRSTA